MTIKAFVSSLRGKSKLEAARVSLEACNEPQSTIQPNQQASGQGRVACARWDIWMSTWEPMQQASPVLLASLPPSLPSLQTPASIASPVTE